MLANELIALAIIMWIFSSNYHHENLFANIKIAKHMWAKIVMKYFNN